MYQITLIDDKGNSINNFTQWDMNQRVRIVIDGIDKDYFKIIPQMHFANKNSKEALVVGKPNVEVVTTNSENDTIVADVPNALLQEAYPLLVYVYFEEGNEGNHDYLDYDDGTDSSVVHQLAANPQKTLIATEVPVRKRAKPSDYEYVENIERITAEQIKKEISQDISNGELIIKYISFPDLILNDLHRVYVSNEKLVLENVEYEGREDSGNNGKDILSMTPLEIVKTLGLSSLTYANKIDSGEGDSDLNMIMSAGTYAYKGGENIENSPIDTPFRLFVGRLSDTSPLESDITSQEIVDISNGDRFYRVFDGTSWGSWIAKQVDVAKIQDEIDALEETEKSLDKDIRDTISSSTKSLDDKITQEIAKLTDSKTTSSQVKEIVDEANDAVLSSVKSIYATNERADGLQSYVDQTAADIREEVSRTYLPSANAEETYATKDSLEQTAEDFRSSISETNTNLSSLTKTVENNNTEIGNINKRHNDLSQTVSDVDAAVKDVNGKHSALSQDVGEFKTNVSKTYLSKDDASKTYATLLSVESLSGSYQSQQESITAQQTQIGELNTKTGELGAQIEAMKTQIEDLKAQIEALKPKTEEPSE